MDKKINNKVPVEMYLSVLSINTAIEYWLNNQVFKNDIKIHSVEWNQREMIFEITFDREEQKGF